MAGKVAIIGRTLLMLLIIVVILAGGLLWFDYLNLIDIRTLAAPIFNLFGQETRTQPASPSPDYINLDSERLAIRLEALDLQKKELDQKEADVEAARRENEQQAQTLAEERAAFEEEKAAGEASVAEAQSRQANVNQQATYLQAMTPAAAAAMLLRISDDQLVIDILRATEAQAQAAGTTSMVSVWLSQMAGTNAEGAARVAEIQRKMANR
ncbi:MAG: flagellar protein FlbB [Spirochaetaceae bacterium]|jgi:flagellar protein FlbB|nr:flagellar protein FlbB [Spirochaetaceae bacterium]